METWKSVLGYGGLYEVSDQGRVRSLDRVVESYGGREGLRRGRVLRPGGGGPYSSVQLSMAGRVRTVRIHTLVLEAFVGPRPDGLEACHANGDPADNRLTNLRWDTRVANCADRARHGRTRRGERHHNAVLSDQDVHEIRRRRAAGETGVSLAAEFGVSPAQISRVVHRKSRV